MTGLARPHVVCGESKQVPVLLVECDILEVVVHQLCHVFGAAMDVGVGLVNIADAESPAGFGHQLHQANRTDAATGALVDTRFLIALRDQQEGVEPVLARIAPEDLDRVTFRRHARGVPFPDPMSCSQFRPIHRLPLMQLPAAPVYLIDYIPNVSVLMKW
jgi:hypothetical protein